jgi:hypothetical protein
VREVVSHAIPAAFRGAGRDPTLVVRGLEDFLSPVRRVVNMVFLCLWSGLGLLDICFAGTANVGGAGNGDELI